MVHAIHHLRVRSISGISVNIFCRSKVFCVCSWGASSIASRAFTVRYAITADNSSAMHVQRRGILYLISAVYQWRVNNVRLYLLWLDSNAIKRKKDVVAFLVRRRRFADDQLNRSRLLGHDGGGARPSVTMTLSHIRVQCLSACCMLTAIVAEAEPSDWHAQSLCQSVVGVYRRRPCPRRGLTILLLFKE